MAAEDNFRAKSSRPVYRRAGLVLGMSAWTEFTLALVGAEGMQRLAADPVVTLQIQDGKDWVAVPAELRGRWAQLGEVDPESFEPVDSAEERGELRRQLEVAAAEIEMQRQLLERRSDDQQALLNRNGELETALAAARQEIADLGDVNEAQKAALATIDGLRDQVADLTAQLAARPPASTDTPEERAEGQQGGGDPAVPAKPDASGAKTSAKAKTPAKSE